MSESPLFSFVHATDLHWGEPIGHLFRPARRRADCFVRDMQSLGNKPRFIVLSGDITESGPTEPDELTLGMEQIALLPSKTYFVPGNHDLEPVPAEGQTTLPPIDQTTWYARFGDAGLFWTAVEGPLELIGFAHRNGDPDGILDRLAAHLAKPPKGKRVLVSHFPVYPARDGGVLSKWGTVAIQDSHEKLRTIVADHADTVVAYLYGHIHALAAQVNDRVLHASGGMVAAGAPGYRLFAVYPDRLTSRFVPLSDESLVEYNFWGLMNPEIATSPQYPTTTAYHGGHPLERDFSYDFQTRTMRPLEAD